MESPSGLLKAGTILLLVGAILSTLGGLVLVFMGWTVANVLIVTLGGLLFIGAALGYVAWARVRRGRLGHAVVLGIVSALLPPLQGLQLIGAILVRASPEAERLR